MNKFLLSALVIILSFSMGLGKEAAKALCHVNGQQQDFVYHKVESGQTVYSIANMYGVEQEDIYRFNPGSRTMIRSGSTLRIPTARQADEATSTTRQIENNFSPDLPTETYAKGETEIKIQQFIDEINRIIEKQINDADDLNEANKRLNSLDIKWNAFFQSKQNEIAENEQVLDMVSSYQQLRQATTDTIGIRKQRMEASENFAKADKFIASKKKEYQELYETAVQLSLVQKLADQLEALKGKEQLLSAEVDKNYEQAKEAANLQKGLKHKMEKLENNYIELKNYSEKIQAAEYKPFFERIKEYLFGLAAVTIILMFVNMLQAKIKMIKQARENAKKFKEMNQGQDDYPTI